MDISGGRLAIKHLFVSNTDNIVPVKPVLRAEILPVLTGNINTEPPCYANTGEYP